MQEPREVYTALQSERRASVMAGEGRQRRLGYWRLAAVAAAGALVWLALSGPRITILWTLIPAAAFVALMAAHARLTRQVERERRAARFFERGLARLDGSWPGTGNTGDAYLDLAHPYAQDLDLFGKGSLFELLSTARTHIGEGPWRAGCWRRPTASGARAPGRRSTELRPRLDLREDLAVLAKTRAPAWTPCRWPPGAKRRRRLEGAALRLALWACTPLGNRRRGGRPVAAAQPGRHRCACRAAATAAARSVPRSSLARQRLVPATAIGRARCRSGGGGGGGGARAGTALRGAGAAGARAVSVAPLLAALRASLDAEGAPPSAPPRPAQPADGATWIRAITSSCGCRAVPAVDAARGAASGRLAPPLGTGGAALAHRHRAKSRRCARSPATPSSIRTIRSRNSSKAAACLEAEGIGHPLDSGRARVVRNDVRIGGPLRAAGGQRLEHVRQEHAAAHAGSQRRAGAGGRAGARPAAAPLAAGGGGLHLA